MKMCRKFFAFAMMACMSIALSACSAAAVAVGASYRVVKSFVGDGFKLAANKVQYLNPVLLRLVQVKASDVRPMKRERPVLTGSWRMCPSS